MDNGWRKKELLISMIQFYFQNLFEEIDNVIAINTEGKFPLLNSDQNRLLSGKLIDSMIKKESLQALKLLKIMNSQLSSIKKLEFSEK